MSRNSTDSPVHTKTRDYIVSMLEDGWSDKEILECFPEVGQGSVTAFRAHLTRGTYDGTKRKSKASLRRIPKNRKR